MRAGQVFGQQLRQLRKARDLTQAALAARAGCAVITLQKIEAGDLRPSRQIAERLAGALGLSGESHQQFLREARPQSTPDGPILPSGPPTPTTALIGRAMDLETIGARLRDGTRLLTLIGPPGIGKTRLLIAALAAIRAEYPDGVGFVALAELDDPALVPEAIARALGLEAIGGRPAAELLRGYLAGRRLVIGLDNCEHLTAAAPLTGALLAESPGLAILATSREPLRVYGEQELAIDALDLESAVALFAERAGAVRRDFTLTPANYPAVAEICTRLDRLPLAIELIAARCRHLAPRTLLGRLSNDLPLDLLAGDTRDLPARQATLAVAIDWSYRLLDPREQELFVRLGVCAGGWDLAMAEALAPQLAGVEPILHALSTRSLVRVEFPNEDEPRFSMLATIRAYALAHLAQHPEASMIRMRYAEYLLELAELADKQLLGPDLVGWLDWLDRELANLRGVLAWGLAHPRDTRPREVALRIAGALALFWHLRGHWDEAAGWLDHLLDQARADRFAIARGAYAAGVLAWARRDYPSAREWLNQALELATETGAERLHADTLGFLGLTALYAGQLNDARISLNESLACFQTIEESGGIALALLRLGIVALQSGEHEQSDQLLARSLALFQEIGNPWGVATTQATLADREIVLGDHRRAASLYAGCLPHYKQLRSHWYMAHMLAALGSALGRLGQADTAAMLFGAAEAQIELLGVGMHALDRDMYQPGIDATQSQISPAAYESLRSAGRALTIDQALQIAESVRTGAIMSNGYTKEQVD